MKVRMMVQVLPPSMQDAEKAGLRAHVRRVGSDLQQSRSASAEQQMIHDLLVVERQPGQFVRQRKDHMEVADREAFLAPLSQPKVARVGEALRAVRGPARVIRDVGTIAASGTTVDVAAERRRTAVLDGVKNPQMLICQPRTVVLDEGFPVLSNDIRHLEGWRVHDRFCSFRERFTLSGFEISTWSSGLATADRCFPGRCT